MTRRATIKRIWKTARRPFRRLKRWASKPEKKKYRRRRWRAMFRWAKAHWEQAGEKLGWKHSKTLRWRRRKRSYAESYRQLKRDRKIVISPGDPHWGGAEDILVNEVVPVARRAGVGVTSGKRWATFGNPGSDHYKGNTTASARDFGTTNNYGLRDKIMRELGVDGPIRDYGHYYIQRAGRTFRVQPIAGTHGTGGHLHLGIKLV